MEIETIVNARDNFSIGEDDWDEAVRIGKEISRIVKEHETDWDAAMIGELCADVDLTCCDTGSFEWTLVICREIPLKAISDELLAGIAKITGGNYNYYLRAMRNDRHLVRFPFNVREIPLVKKLLGIIGFEESVQWISYAYLQHLQLTPNTEAAFAIAEITKVLPMWSQLPSFFEMIGPDRANLLLTSGDYYLPQWKFLSGNAWRLRGMTKTVLDMVRRYTKSATPYAVARKFLLHSTPDPDALYKFSTFTINDKGNLVFGRSPGESVAWKIPLSTMQQALQLRIRAEAHIRWFHLRRAIQLNAPWYLSQLDEFLRPGGRGPEWLWERANLEAFGCMPPHEFTCDEEAVRPTKRSRTHK